MVAPDFFIPGFSGLVNKNTKKLLPKTRALPKALQTLSSQSPKSKGPLSLAFLRAVTGLRDLRVPRKGSRPVTVLPVVTEIKQR